MQVPICLWSINDVLKSLVTYCNSLTLNKMNIEQLLNWTLQKLINYKKEETF